MSYVGRKLLVFQDNVGYRLQPRRSEARLKNYTSATDVRVWSDDVEQRRQYILELLVKNRGKCLGSLIPVEALISMLLALNEGENAASTPVSKSKKDGKFEDNCENALSNLANDIEEMKNGKILSSEVRKQVENLRQYCKKLSNIQAENDRLKLEQENLQKQIGSQPEHSLKTDVETHNKSLDKLGQERDKMMDRISNLESELKACKEASKKMDDILKEKDKLSRELEQLRKSHKDIGEITEKSSDELRKKLAELQREKENMENRMKNMQKENDDLKSKNKENEILKLERDKLQIKLSDMSQLQEQVQVMGSQSNMYDSLKKERDIYKQKYEELLGMECKCDMLQTQVDSAKDVIHENQSLKQQVGNLENYVVDQEKTLSKCTCDIEQLKATNGKQKDNLAALQAEIEKKNYLIAASNEKLSHLQHDMRNSVEGVTEEANSLKEKIDCLEKELTQTKASLAEKVSQIKYLQQQSKEREICMCEERNMYKTMTKSDSESIAKMKKDLESAREENKKLQEIARKMVSITGDQHVHQMLKQSQCAVKRVVEELGKHYNKAGDSKSTKTCSAGQNYDELIAHLGKFKERVSELEAENAKLKAGLDSGTGSIHCKDGATLKRELQEIQAQKDKLEEHLKREMKVRQNLEKKVGNIQPQHCKC